MNHEQDIDDMKKILNATRSIPEDWDVIKTINELEQSLDNDAESMELLNKLRTFVQENAYKIQTQNSIIEKFAERFVNADENILLYKAENYKKANVIEQVKILSAYFNSIISSATKAGVTDSEILFLKELFDTANVKYNFNEFFKENEVLGLNDIDRIVKLATYIPVHERKKYESKDSAIEVIKNELDRLTEEYERLLNS